VGACRSCLTALSAVSGGADRRKSISGHFLFFVAVLFFAFFAPFFFFAILITSFPAS
jgi:hypothetical protein